MNDAQVTRYRSWPPPRSPPTCGCSAGTCPPCGRIRLHLQLGKAAKLHAGRDVSCISTGLMRGARCPVHRQRRQPLLPVHRHKRRTPHAEGRSQTTFLPIAIGPQGNPLRNDVDHGRVGPGIEPRRSFRRWACGTGRRCVSGACVFPGGPSALCRAAQRRQGDEGATRDAPGGGAGDVAGRSDHRLFHGHRTNGHGAPDGLWARGGGHRWTRGVIEGCCRFERAGAGCHRLGRHGILPSPRSRGGTGVSTCCSTMPGAPSAE